MSNVRVCVDVVGGDEKPQVVLDGIEAALAADSEIEILAVGPAEIVNPFAAAHARVEALEAPDVISMEDDPHPRCDDQAQVLRSCLHVVPLRRAMRTRFSRPARPVP